MKKIDFITKSTSVQPQRLLMMMATILMAFATLTACDDENAKEDIDKKNASSAEKAAVKYLQVHLTPAYNGLPVHLYVIFDDYGKRYREDWWGPIKDYGDDYISLYDHWQSEIENHYNKTHWKSIYKGEWEDEKYETEKLFLKTWVTVQKAISDGFKKQSNQITLAGKLCDIYTLTLSNVPVYGDVTYTYAFWSDIVMMHETKVSASGEILARVEAVAVTLDVPAIAFTKTLDITWLPK
jgi:hypothetical protein